MKKYLLLLALCAFMFSCSGDKPRKVAESFLTEMSKGNFDKASNYCTPQTAALLSMAAQMSTEEMKKENFKFNYVREEVDGETAKVFFTDETGEEDSVDLVKVDGKWKVVLSK